jgi:REP element-mobilizing transposase RayT
MFSRMPDYTRVYRPGGSYFFTLVTEGRAPILCEPVARRLLHEAIDICRRKRPFALDAIVLLPDHLHAIWTLPEGDEDFSTRWAAIKASHPHAWGFSTFQKWVKHAGYELDWQCVCDGRSPNPPQFHELEGMKME